MQRFEEEQVTGNKAPDSRHALCEGWGMPRVQYREPVDGKQHQHGALSPIE
jgi:hypothetical protein